MAIWIHLVLLRQPFLRQLVTRREIDALLSDLFWVTRQIVEVEVDAKMS